MVLWANTHGSVLLGAAKLASGYPVLAAVSATLVTIGFGVLAFSMMGLGVPPARGPSWRVVCSGPDGLVAERVSRAIRAY